VGSKGVLTVPAVPSYLLKKVYLRGSLRNSPDGFELTLRNDLAPATILGLTSLTVDGKAYASDTISLRIGETWQTAASVTRASPQAFALNAQVTLRVEGEPLAPGRHSLVIVIQTKEAGQLEVPAAEVIGEEHRPASGST
jgi:hydroxymethylglutaryl-CoA reductase (NADPH)